MKIAHFSDTHLGYSRYGRRDGRGLNQRLVDVVETFQRVLDSILSFDPEVVVHAGDFFDKERPSNLVIVSAYRRLARFQKDRGGKPLVIIAGNHDSPKSADAANILGIFGEHEPSEYAIPGVYVVTGHARRIVIPEIKLECLCLPWSANFDEVDVRAEDRNNTCVVVAHGLESSLNLPGATLSMSRMNYTEWDYVALGDYHIEKVLADNVHYCGSTDYTSSNFWDEGLQKGWKLFDSETREVRFVPVEPMRGWVPLPPIEAAGLSGEEIGLRMQANAHWEEDTFPIVRQVVNNCDPVARAEVPHAVRAELHQRALHYQLDMFLAPKDGKESAEALPRGATLSDDWQVFATQRQLTLSVDRDEFVETGHRLIKEAASASEEN